MTQPGSSPNAPQPPGAPALRFAIAATFTAEPLASVLAFWGRTFQTPVETAFAPYNQVTQTLLDPAGLFAANPDGLNVVLIRYEDLAQFHQLDQPALRQLESNLAALTETLRQATVPLLVALCPSRPGLAAGPAFSASLDAARKLLAGPRFLSDLDIAAAYPVPGFYDPEGERLGRIPYTGHFFAALGTALFRRAHALVRPPFKVIAVDCDNTLWQGICGEDNPEGVALDPPRRRLHQFLLAQRDAGMILALSSKNNEQDVFDTFAAHPEFPLQLDHFTTWRLNWEPKAAGLAAMAAELNLGLDSFILLDDNPKECAEVAQALPEVLSLALPEPIAGLPAFLEHVWAFDHGPVTTEDRRRAEFARQGLEFGRAARQAASLEEFIAGLDLRVDIEPLTPDRTARVAQLTRRTNQFNSTTIRRTESDIQSLLSAGCLCFTAEASDRFGDYGLVGAMIVERRPAALYVDTFLLSCRALGRGVEHRMLAALAEQALNHGIYTVEVAFHPTPRNRPAAQFLDSIPDATREGDLYRFPATSLQTLRWRPTPPCGAGLQPAPGFQPAHNAPYAAIARNLRTPDQILTALRRQTHTAPSPDDPNTETERKLARIWSELLEKPIPDRRASFFDLGGHSLLAVLLLMRIREEFQVELSVDDVYSGALTLDDLARTIEARRLGALDPEEYQALLAEIEGLTDEEVQALLDKEDGDEAGG